MPSSTKPVSTCVNVVGTHASCMWQPPHSDPNDPAWMSSCEWQLPQRCPRPRMLPAPVWHVEQATMVCAPVSEKPASSWYVLRGGACHFSKLWHESQASLSRT